MKNREQFKRILNFAGAIIISFAFVYGFSHIWYNHYNSKMLDPFWFNGNILMVVIYAVVYIFSAVSFNGFRLGYERTMGLFGSQVLAILGTNIFEFVIISLIGRGRLSVVPIFLLTLCEVAFSIVWSWLFTKIYKKIYPPRKLLVVYGNKNAKFLITKMSKRTDKYNICEAISCDKSLEEIESERGG